MNAYIISALEIVVVAFTVWCLFNEQKLVAFEKRIVKKFRRRRFKVVNGGRSVNKYYA